jgi:hypothetical protein
VRDGECGWRELFSIFEDFLGKKIVETTKSNFSTYSCGEASADDAVALASNTLRSMVDPSQRVPCVRRHANPTVISPQSQSRRDAEFGMATSRAHVPGAEDAPLLVVNEPVQGGTDVVRVGGRESSRGRGTSMRVVGTIALALVVAFFGTVGSAALAANGSANLVTPGSTLGGAKQVGGAGDPMEGSGERPMSAYGTMDEDSLSAIVDATDPLEKQNTEAKSAARKDTPKLVPGVDEHIPTRGVTVDGGDAAAIETKKLGAKKLDPMDALFDPLDSLMADAASGFPQDSNTPSTESSTATRAKKNTKDQTHDLDATESESPYMKQSKIQSDVDDAIEIEMKRLDKAAREMDETRLAKATASMKGGTHAASEKKHEAKKRSGKESTRSEKKPTTSSKKSDETLEETTAGVAESVAAAVQANVTPLPSVTTATVSPTTATSHANPSPHDVDRTANSDVKERYARAAEAAISGDVAGVVLNLAMASPTSIASADGSATVGEAVTLVGDGHDGSWWRMIEGQARSGRGEEPPVAQGVGVAGDVDAVAVRGTADGIVGGPIASTGTCDWTRCDKNAGPQVVDNVCVENGGLGCVGKTGCRFCKAGMVGEAGLPICPPCVCAAMGVEGCSVAAAYSSAAVTATASAQAAATASVTATARTAAVASVGTGEVEDTVSISHLTHSAD